MLFTGVNIVVCNYQSSVCHSIENRQPSVYHNVSNCQNPHLSRFRWRNLRTIGILQREQQQNRMEAVLTRHCPEGRLTRSVSEGREKEAKLQMVQDFVTGKRDRCGFWQIESEYAEQTWIPTHVICKKTFTITPRYGILWTGS